MLERLIFELREQPGGIEAELCMFYLRLHSSNDHRSQVWPLCGQETGSWSPVLVAFLPFLDALAGSWLRSGAAGVPASALRDASCSTVGPRNNSGSSLCDRCRLEKRAVPVSLVSVLAASVAVELRGVAHLGPRRIMAQVFVSVLPIWEPRMNSSCQHLPDPVLAFVGTWDESQTVMHFHLFPSLRCLSVGHLEGPLEGLPGPGTVA